jgi:hypothetical protein
MKESPVKDIKIEEERDNLREFLQDMSAFLEFCRDKQMPALYIIGNLQHDIIGLLNRDRCFLPRVSGYASLQNKRNHH